MKAIRLRQVCIALLPCTAIVTGVVLLHRWQYPYGQKVGALPLVTLALREHAIDHGGWFPTNGQTALQALQTLYPKYIEQPRYLAGLSGDVHGTKEALRRGRPLDDKTSSWIYWPGFREDDGGELDREQDQARLVPGRATKSDLVAIIWEREGGILLNGKRGSGHAVGFSDGSCVQISDADWPDFLKRQRELRQSILSRRQRATTGTSENSSRAGK